MAIINRIDRITNNESDQFMAGQYIDLLAFLLLYCNPSEPSLNA